MTAISVRELSYNPSAVLSRVEKGETIDVTRHGHVIAVLIPPPRKQSRFDELVAQGAIRPAERGLTTSDLDQYTRIEVPDDVDPLAILLEMREHER
ncbi:type II toxin-antitoxin system Phd/YefM family antitoxin [Amycolatopsis pithecellobii]|uniref:Antitoxin n=1 Tax=Amycolatopsis pithecellobii TaxID=664692 RepID=A0A6N7ZB42_9PSEU|nr:type II toxin-antitoxin system prevent-host-death family antitoxin [Amycolatopsis pithecellobii]MTD58981.1 type II toxin-antitoxin system prevent-host-death family antitoxin [Amycolatopsis pithecellobii]